MRKALVVGLFLTAVAAVANAAQIEGLLVDARTASTHLAYAEKLVGLPVADMLANQDAGFGLVVNGRFHKFDRQGDELARQLLFSESPEASNLRVRVEGELQGLDLAVTAVTRVNR